MSMDYFSNVAIMLDRNGLMNANELTKRS